MTGHTHSEPSGSFGTYLRYLRRRARLTQTQLSVAVGYSTGQISMLENGQRSPDVTAVIALFVGALGLQDDRQAAARLVQLAQLAAMAARAANVPATTTAASPRSTGTLHQSVTWQEEELGVLEDIPPLPNGYIERPEPGGQIARCLRREHRAAICGLPGMGKSTLAAAFAHEYARRHPVCWLSFGQGRYQTAAELLRQLALFCLVTGGAAASAAVVRRIAAGSATGPARQQFFALVAALNAIEQAPLLVFDDAHEVSAQAEIMAGIRSLLTGAPYCRMVFVTRETLDLPGIPNVMLEGLEHQEALQMMDSLISLGDAATASSTGTTEEEFDPLIARTAGNPLLLRLTISQLGQPHRLSSPMPDGQPVGRLMNAVLTRLSPSARHVLDLLVVWQKTLDLTDPALQALLTSADTAYDHADAVSQLTRSYLIEHSVYAVLHPWLLEALAADLRSRQDDARRTQQLAARWALAQGDTLTAARCYVAAGDVQAAGAVLLDEQTEHLLVSQAQSAVAVIDTVVAALRQQPPDSAQRSLLGRLLARRGDCLINTARATEAHIDYRAAIEVTDDTLPRLHLAYRLCKSLLQVGQHRDALQLWTEAARQLDGMEGAEVVRLRAQMESVRARALIGVDQLADAAAVCHNAIDLARSLRLANPILAEKICTDAYRGLGYIVRRQGHHAEARPYFARAISHARSAGLQNEEAETLGYMSAVLRDLGDFTGAIQQGEEALAVAQRAGNDHLVANLLHYMSITCYYHGRLAQALAYSQQAASKHQTMGDSEGMVSCDILQAVVYAARGPLRAAVAAIDRAVSDSLLFDNRWLQGMALYVYGIVHTFAGNLALAAAALRRALDIRAFTQDAPMGTSAQIFLGINCVADGAIAEAQTIEQGLPAPCAVEVDLLAGLFRGMLYLASGDTATAQATASATCRRGAETGYLIYASEATRLYRACAAPPPLAALPAAVCCEIQGADSDAGGETIIS